MELWFIYGMEQVKCVSIGLYYFVIFTFIFFFNIQNDEKSIPNHVYNDDSILCMCPKWYLDGSCESEEIFFNVLNFISAALEIGK